MIYLFMFKLAAAFLMTTIILVIVTRGLDETTNSMVVTIGGIVLVLTLLTSFLAVWMWVFNI